jgi:hypothetical protein
MRLDLLGKLQDDHRQLLALVDRLEHLLARLTNPPTPADLTALQEALEQFIAKLSSHGAWESREFFPALRGRLNEGEQWLIGMTEIQDEAMLSEAEGLHRLVSDATSIQPIGKLKEDGGRLVRWVREHVMIEEERLFTKLDRPPSSQ